MPLEGLRKLRKLGGDTDNEISVAAAAALGAADGEDGADDAVAGRLQRSLLGGRAGRS